MNHMKHIPALFVVLLCCISVRSQTPEDLLQKVRAKLDKVTDYEAKGKMKTNVVFLKAPVATVKIYFKKPNKLRIHNEGGISLIPKGSVNMNLNNLFLDGPAAYDVIDLGKEASSQLRIITL